MSDEQPGDAVGRLVLADPLEELGRDAEARAQRLLAERGLWTDNDLAFEDQTGWRWWNDAGGKLEHRRHARIPTDLLAPVPAGEWLNETRGEAESVLIRVLRKAGKP